MSLKKSTWLEKSRAELTRNEANRSLFGGLFFRTSHGLVEEFEIIAGLLTVRVARFLTNLC